MAGIHRAETSLLSTTSGFVDYHGMLNQCLLLVVVSTGRIVLKSIQRNGLNIHFALIRALVTAQLIPSIAATGAFALLTFAVECGAVSLPMLRVPIHLVVLVMMLALPAVQINRAAEQGHPVHPLAAVLVLCSVLTVWMKLISFCLRPKDKPFPVRVMARKFLFFMLAPTLIFEYEYPRNEKIRWPFVVRRCAEIIFLTVLMAIIGEKWISPIIDTNPISMGDIGSQPLQVLLKLTSLAFPNHVAWIMFFYCYFHSTLNLCAELLRFADRCFYLDWWNASYPGEFWRKWNVPVHRYAHLYVYKPLRHAIGSRFLAGLTVFFASAVAHEFVASVALRVPGSYMFVAMMMQPLLDYVMYNALIAGVKTPTPRRRWAGNMILWILVMFGHPISVIMYVNDYRYYHHKSNATSA